LRPERGCRGSFWRFGAESAHGRTQQYLANEIFCCKQIPRKEKVILPVNFHIPGPLREFTGGRSKVEIKRSPATVADALSELWSLYPGLRDRITTEQGQVREHINIFIGDEDIRYTGGLMSPVPAESQISIVPAISGG
jgi:sulfur-carrier protein